MATNTIKQLENVAADAASLAPPPPQQDPLAAFSVERVEQKDLADITEFMLGDFLHNESLNQSVELNRQESEQFFAGLAEMSLPSGLNYVVREPAAQNRVIALRMATIVHRDEQNNDETGGDSSFAEWGNNNKTNWKVGQIAGIVHEVESKIWQLLPKEYHCLASWVFLSVDSEYKRRGIATALLHYRMDEIRERGCQGIMTEASALNSQNLFQKLGYARLFELHHSEWKDPNTGERVFNCRDGTDRVTLEFMPLVHIPAGVQKQQLQTTTAAAKTAAMMMEEEEKKKKSN